MTQIKDSKFLSFYKNISIFAFVLMQPCMIVNETIVNLGLTLTQGRILLLGNIFALAVIALTNIKLFRLQKFLVAAFLFSTLYFLILSRLFPNSIGLSRPISNFVSIILIFIIINNKKFNYSRLFYFFIYVAFILSALSVIQYLGNTSGLLKLKTYIYNTYSPGWRVGINFGGFADTSGGFSILRNQSFFIEPARFAQFLMIPLFLSLYSVIYKQKYSLLIFVTIAVAFVLTFSVANFFGLIFGFILFFLFFRKKKSQKFNLSTRIISLIILTVVVFIGINLFDVSNEYSYGSGVVIGKNTVESVLTRLDRFQFVQSALSHSFFGNPNLRIIFNRNPSAIGLAIIFGGIPFLLLCLWYAGLFYSTIFHRILKNSRFSLIYVGSIAYFIPFNWYGMFTENLFLFQIIFFASILKLEFHRSTLNFAVPNES